jgi:hypothetical protein
LYVSSENSVSLLHILGFASGQTRSLATFHPKIALQPGQEYDLELRLVGPSLTAKLDGEILGTATDGSISEGNFGIVASGTGEAAVVKSYEFLDLDKRGAISASLPLAETKSSSPATATKDAPFVNSLGMKFVPVPITGGPTDKQRVLFSIWETRVRDYETFVAETKRAWGKPNFEQGAEHPAVLVSWEDAQAFCRWLTTRERAAGRLGPGEEFRLPSDHEWSCAAGIAARENAALPPASKDCKITDAFPWGSAWPPPPRAGNYSGLERPLPGSSPPAADELGGYRDDFPSTSPAGSFAANPFGLFDVGGNVWEWCEDRHSPSSGTMARVRRGSSFQDHAKSGLLSSLRGSGPPDRPEANVGFRVVLAPVEAIKAASTPTPATKDAPFTNSLGM